MSHGAVRVANKQYNNCNHRYELTFDRNAFIEEVAGEPAEAFKVPFNFTDLRAIHARQLPCRVDICGVVSHFGAAQTLTAKDGRELVKRDLSIADDTATTFVVTLWADKARLPDSELEGQPIVAISKVLVKEYCGERCGGTSESSSVVLKPDVPEAKRIEQWWVQGGSKQSLANFTDLQSVQSKPMPCRIDLCGVVTQFKEPAQLISKDGKELLKRDITVADDTGVSIDVTLWGDKARLPDTNFEGNPTICMTSVLVKEWNGGRSGSTLESSRLLFRPECIEATRIQQWWSQGGSTQSLVSLRGAGGGGGAAANAEQCTVSDMRRKSELVGDQAMFFKITCRLGLVQLTKQGEQHPLHYLACAELRDGYNGGKLPCNRRVDASGFCAACDRAGKTVVRLNLRCRFVDFGESVWLTTFHEAAEKVLGMQADKVAQIDNGAGGREQLEEALRQRYFGQQLELTVKAKLDMWNGEPKTNVTCVGAALVNRRERGFKLLAEIQDMLAADA